MNKLPPDSFILDLLKKGDLKTFKLIFDTYYEGLVRYAIKMLHKPEVGEEIVQDVFERLWLRRKELQINTSLSAYLYASVRYRCINYLKSKIQNFILEDNLQNIDQPTEYTPLQELEFKDLTEAIRASIDTLPEQCRAIFSLSRNSGLSNPEIAEQLNLSPKTIENQIGIALKKIREFLQKNWYAIFLIFFWGCFIFHLT
jgi:RNA polymerase sigma-70 factor (ECF subfamily)